MPQLGPLREVKGAAVKHHGGRFQVIPFDKLLSDFPVAELLPVSIRTTTEYGQAGMEGRILCLKVTSAEGKDLALKQNRHPELRHAAFRLAV